MSFDAVKSTLGELFGFSDSKGWSLVGADVGFEKVEFKGQFVTENYREGGGDVNLGENSTLNQNTPNLQYLSGDSEFASFTTVLFATNSLKNIKSQINLLKSFKKRDPDLGRPPIFLFSNGKEIQFTCFVKKADFAYREMRNDGAVHGVEVSIVLQILEDSQVGDAATSLASQIKTGIGLVAGAAGLAGIIKNKINIPGGSLHTIDRTYEVRQGDTFERIAQREYGDPLLGDVLRRTQPEKAELKIEDVILLVDPTEITEIEVTQQSVALKDTQENLTLREDKLCARNRKTTIFI